MSLSKLSKRGLLMIQSKSQNPESENLPEEPRIGYILVCADDRNSSTCHSLVPWTGLMFAHG